jgi:hypothetical protein
MICKWENGRQEGYGMQKWFNKMTPTSSAHGPKRHEEEWTKYGTQVEKTNLA